MFGLARPGGTRHCAALPSQHSEAEDTRPLWGFLWVFSCLKRGQWAGRSPKACSTDQMDSSDGRRDYPLGLLLLWSKPSLLPSKTHSRVPPQFAAGVPHSDLPSKSQTLHPANIPPSHLRFPAGVPPRGRSLLSHPRIRSVFHLTVFQVHLHVGRSVGGGTSTAFGSPLVRLSPCWSLATIETQRAVVTQ